MENNSPTGEAPVQAASVPEPTAPVTEVTNPAESVNQETNTVAPVTTASVSDETANPQPQPASEEKQTQPKGGESQTDDGLAKFAKSQGFDPENLTDGERKALKIAHDNQKAYRSKTVAESKASVSGDVTKDELESFRNEFKQYQATRQAEAFFKEEGRDDSLAPVMSEILEEKKTAYGPEYAKVLAEDLSLLYDLARVRGGGTAQPVDPEQVRQAERESINRQFAAGGSAQHATQSAPTNQVVVNREWFATTYDPNNDEHRKLADEYFAS